MGKSKTSLVTKKRSAVGPHGGNRGGLRTARSASPRRGRQVAGKNPQRGRKER